jgi:hypothetical protein
MPGPIGYTRAPSAADFGSDDSKQQIVMRKASDMFHIELRPAIKIRRSFGSMLQKVFGCAYGSDNS